MSLVGEREGVINFIRNSHQVILNIVLLAASSLHDQKSGKLTKTETNSLISNASVEQKNAFGSNKIQLPSMSHLLPLGGMLSRTFRIVFNRLYGSFRWFCRLSRQFYSLRPWFLEISEKCLSQHDDHQLTTTPAPVTDNQYNKCVLPEVSPKLTIFWSTTSYRMTHTVNVGRGQLACNLFGLVE